MSLARLDNSGKCSCVNYIKKPSCLKYLILFDYYLFPTENDFKISNVIFEKRYIYFFQNFRLELKKVMKKIVLFKKS